MPSSTPSPARVLTFSAGGDTFAVDAAAVREIMSTPPLTRVPLASPIVKGVANIRGRPGPVLALEHAVARARISAGGKIVVLRGEAPVGLAIDEALDVKPYDPSDGARLLDTEAIVRDIGPGRRSAAATRLGETAEGPVAATPADLRSFLLVRLTGQDYALPLDDVVEVLPSGAFRALQAWQDDDPALLGAMAWRDRRLPVARVSTLLGLEAGPAPAAGRVIVVMTGDAPVGLLVDRIDGILRIAAERIDKAPAVLNRSKGGEITAIARSDRGLVSVLSPERLFEDDLLSRLIDDGSQRASAAPQDDLERERRLVARLDETAYGLRLRDVEAVIAPPGLVTPAPRAASFVTGLFNHRGRAVPLVDAGRAAGTDARSRSPRVVVVTVGDRSAGLLFDSVDEVAEIAIADLVPPGGSRLAGAVEALFGHASETLLKSVVSA